MTIDKRVPTILIIGGLKVSEAVSTELINNGLKVMTAPTEVEALRTINIKKPDLIVMNLDSQRSAKELMSIIKNYAKLALIPIIAVLEFKNAHEKVELFEAGAFDCVAVPFENEELLCKIKSYLKMYMLCTDLMAQNQLIRDIATVDEVTGLFNKRYFMGRIGSEVSRAVRMGEDLSFVIVNIDDFDDIEKTYGSDASEFVIKQMAFDLKDVVRLSDILVRYGDNEMAILCPMTDNSGVETFVEKIRKKIERNTFDYKDARIRTTVSIGAYTLSSSDFNNVETKIHNIVNFAEEALERAKRRDENKVEFYENE